MQKLNRTTSYPKQTINIILTKNGNIKYLSRVVQKVHSAVIVTKLGEPIFRKTAK